MVILFDADGLIKLHRAGVLAKLAQARQCVIPDKVYQEVVTAGNERHYPDASEIDGIVMDWITIQPTEGLGRPDFHLDAGETALLALLPALEDDPMIISDDRRFLAVLAQERIAPFMSPTDAIVMMSRLSILAMEEAREALEKIRPHVRDAAYLEAMQDLENLRR